MISRTASLTLALAATACALPALAEVNIPDNHRTLSHTCTSGEAINIAGNDNTLHLSGPCGAINLSGNTNHITTAQATEINTVGNSNTVTWSGGSPRINNVGTGNHLAGTGTAATGMRGHVHSGRNTVSDAAGNSVEKNADGATVVKDAAGNTVTTKPQ